VLVSTRIIYDCIFFGIMKAAQSGEGKFKSGKPDVRYDPKTGKFTYNDPKNGLKEVTPFKGRKCQSFYVGLSTPRLKSFPEKTGHPLEVPVKHKIPLYNRFSTVCYFSFC
jgi:hypothetical protein